MSGRVGSFRELLVTLMVVCGLVASCGPASATTQYTVTDLGLLDSPNSSCDINNRGQVVGRQYDADAGCSRAFLWENGVTQYLDTAGYSQSCATSINELGQIAGWAGWDYTTDHYAALWQNGVMQNLGTLGTGDTSSASAINNLGQVVGFSFTVNNSDMRAFLWEDGVMADLGTLHPDYHSNACGINDLGQVVGIGGVGHGLYHAALWEDGVIEDLGTCGDTDECAWALDINNLGQIVGDSGIGLWSTQAFLLQDGVMESLGTLDDGADFSSASDINELGQVVGWSEISVTSYSSETHAILWENGVMYDLNGFIPGQSEWVLLGADNANDFGQIVGLGRRNGEYRNFLLTPIPEPSTLALAVFGLSLLVRRPSRGHHDAC